MKSDKGMLLIDALFALLVMLIVVNITISFVRVYYRYQNWTKQEPKNENEEESGFDID